MNEVGANYRKLYTHIKRGIVPYEENNTTKGLIYKDHLTLRKVIRYREI